MSRSVSAAARAGLYAQQSAYALPILIEITHGVTGYENPLRLVNNQTALTYNGNVYLPFPFRFDPPDVKESGEISNAKISICAVDQQISAILRSTQTPPSLRAVAMFWNDESGTVFEPMASWSFDLRNVSGNAEIITADLIYESALDFEFPALEFRPTTFPGVF